jgi:hypothetical protein
VDEPVIPAPPALPPSSEAPSPPASRAPRTWWRRNAVALLSLAVLIPATAGAIGWRQWSATFDQPTQRITAITPGENDEVDLAGATWGPVTSGIFTEADGFDLPAGTKIVAVKIPVDNHDLDDVAECGAPMLTEQSSGREWTEMSVAIGLEYDPDSPTTCTYQPEGPYEMLVPFIVPDDASGPYWVDVVPYGTAPVFARFSIDP